MLHRQGLLVLLAVVSVATAGKLPAHIMRCARTDPNVDQCLRAAVADALPKMKNGLPKLGVGPLDPLLISEMRLSQGSNSPVNLDLTFTNMSTTKFLDGVKVESIHFDLDKMVLTAESVTPTVLAVSKYSVKGKVLLLPITGTGDSRVELNDVKTSLRITGKRTKKSDGKDYFEITDVKANMVPKKMSLRLDNLFNGDKQLGDTMNKVLSENWELVFNEISPSLNTAYAELFRRPAHALFIHVPIDGIIPEKL
ncbi:circadian clock-controlled protein-like [Thrips palmi]|uniref:Circadian clock-controlled protein-like n=1 Tax=Thrips palmi TaxID=161013 RepID=A0A6P9A8N7_THRPL|nr:circadian clock-controlled protein-like [Thrips palmi]